MNFLREDCLAKILDMFVDSEVCDLAINSKKNRKLELKMKRPKQKNLGRKGKIFGICEQSSVLMPAREKKTNGNVSEREREREREMKKVN